MNEMTRIVAAPVEAWKAPITTAEFLRMCEADVFEDGKIELVDGELIRMPPPGNDHSRIQVLIVARLLSVAGETLVRGDTAIDLGGNTVLGFDAGLLRQEVSGRQPLRPDQLLLVVEVSETTQHRDLELKRRKYAEAGIDTYWVIDESRGIVHVHREPQAGVYVDTRTVRFGEPLTVPGTDATITLS